MMLVWYYRIQYREYGLTHLYLLFIFDCAESSLHCAGFSWWSTGCRHAGVHSCSSRILLQSNALPLSYTPNSRILEHRLSSCGSRILLLHSTWNLLGPGIELVSPELAGRLSTTVSPGKSALTHLYTPIFQCHFISHS